MMLDANTPEFRAQYPNYCKVYDARGRQIPFVTACNPETGEVIRMDGSWLTGQWLRLTRPRWRLGATTNHGFMWMVCGCEPLEKHGFWPAPLRLVPNPPNAMEGEE